VLVAVGLLVGVRVGLGVRVGVRLGAGVWVKVGLGVCVGLRVAVAVGIRVEVGLGVPVGVQVELGARVGLALGRDRAGVGSSVTLAKVGLDGPGVNSTVEVISIGLAVGLEAASWGCGGSARGRRIKKSTTSRMAPPTPRIMKLVLGDRPCFGGIGGEIATCSSSTASPVATL